MGIEQQKKKQKIAAAVSAGVLAVAIAVTGTYAWQSLSQKAKNIAKGDTNPGGRLHDYFNGENKDIFVENFTDPEKGGVPLFIRVRLDEYMEIGPTAGKTDKTEDEANRTKPLVVGADLNDPETWTPHIPAASSEKCENGDPDTFHKYWNWDMGGETVYMPTFNKNKDSLKSDINGTYKGQDSLYDEGEPYDNYVEYAVGETKKEMAVYDADDNDFDEGDAAVENTNITTVEEEHTAKSTQKAQSLTMEEWKNAGSPKGKYWVYDVDGWAYWAEALEAGEATGLLLDGINLYREPGEKWFYGINVVGQFVTRGDWGDPQSKTGFFADGAGAAPTDDAIFLLKQAADLLPKVTGISFTEGGNVYVKAGESVTLNPKVKVANATDDPAETAVSWSIDQAVDETVFKDGVFHSTEAMTGQTYQVTATSAYNTAFSAMTNIYVYPSEASGVVKGDDGKMYVDYGDNTFKEILADGALGEFVCAGRDEKIGNEDDTTQVVEINPADKTHGSKFIGPDANDGGYWSAATDKKLGTEDDVKVWGDPWPDNIIPYQPGVADAVTVTAKRNKNSTNPGKTLEFSASVTLNEAPIEQQNVTWSISGATKATTKIDANGVLTVGTDEPVGSLITVKAASQAAYGLVGEKTVKVVPEGIAGIEAIEANTKYEATIDGIDWYVLVKENNRALLWAKDAVQTWGNNTGKGRFDDVSPVWRDSEARIWLNDVFLNSLDTLNKHVVATDITTRSASHETKWITTSDKVFLLSEADLFGQHNGVATSEPQDYTYGGAKLVAEISMYRTYSNRDNYVYTWLRSPRSDWASLALLNANNETVAWQSTYSHSELGVRPAMWVTYQ